MHFFTFAHSVAKYFTYKNVRKFRLAARPTFSQAVAIHLACILVGADIATLPFVQAAENCTRTTCKLPSIVARDIVPSYANPLH